MAFSRNRLVRFQPSLSFVLLAALLIVLWLAGGASRENVAGQIVVRAAAWAAIVAVVVIAPRPRLGDARAAAAFLLAAIVLGVLHLVPLPPVMWQALPGRAAFTDPLVSPPGLWRPVSLVPGATVNALLSLVVPAAVMLLVAGMGDDRRRLPAAILTVIALAMLVGLLQFTGARVSNPLVNGGPGAVDGLIANRNHYALFLACGLVLAPVWAFGNKAGLRYKAPVGLGLVALLVLTILASGSRAGLVLGLIALGLGLTLSWRGVRSSLRRYPRWVLPALVGGFVALLATFVLASILSDRAVSIDRAFAGDLAADMRSRGLPTVLAIIRAYFPVGTGLGSFDPMFRMHEPLALLKPTYFNHAHDDFLEVVLTAGLPGALLLLVALGWWGWQSVRAWRAGSGSEHVLPKLGSAILLLIFLASAVDYPARIPLIMALLTIAAIWLGGAGRRHTIVVDRAAGGGGSALPPSDRWL